MSTAKKLMMVGGIDWVAVEIGEPIEGGYYAGTMRFSDGDYAIIVSPKAAETSRAQKTTSAATSDTQSYHDGLANSNAMNNTAHPAAQHCRAYFGGGYSDWYLPARDELELLYRNLKPSTDTNARGQGQNANSVPVGDAYTPSSPAQTAVAVFRVGATEAFALSYYWSSTSDGSAAMVHRFSDGQQYTFGKTSILPVRPVRRVKI